MVHSLHAISNHCTSSDIKYTISIILSYFRYDVLVLSDMRMPDIDGMQVLQPLNKVQPDTPLIIITAHGTIENAVSAMHQGYYELFRNQ